MTSSRSLPVLMPTVPGQRWACHSCGNCCRSLVGHLFDGDKKRLDAQDWVARLGTQPYLRVGNNWVLNKRSDGACVFLQENNLCRIHAEYGEAAKPFACRIFPFSVRPIAQGWQASFRFDCPSATSSKGKSISDHGPWLKQLVGGLGHTPRSAEDLADLQSGLKGTGKELDAVTDLYSSWLLNEQVPLRVRVVGAARVTCTLSAATLGKVRGPRFNELLQLLFDSAAGDAGEPVEDPSPRQLGLLRQIVLVHAEHVSLDEAAMRGWRKLRKRWEQLRKARKFLRGTGNVPLLRDFESESPLPFSRIESEIGPGVDTKTISRLIQRYLVARIQGRSCFGEGYYGWPVVSGMGALWLSLAAAGWLARLRAAAQGRVEVSFDDFAHSLGVVDRAATRLPGPGAWAERIRVGYLMKSDGVARLLRAYLPLYWRPDLDDGDPARETDRAHSAQAGSDA